MVLGHLGGLAAPRVDDDQRTTRVFLYLAQDDPGAREAVRLERVLAQEDGDLGVLEVAVHACAHHLALHPGFASFFLSQGIRSVDHAKGLDRAVGIGGAEVVALAATAVVQDAGATMFGLDGRQFFGDLADGGGPVDVLVAAVGPAPLGRTDAVATVLVVVHALRLFADIALGNRVALIPSRLGDPTTFGLDLQPAV